MVLAGAGAVATGEPRGQRSVVAPTSGMTSRSGRVGESNPRKASAGWASVSSEEREGLPS